MKKLILLTVGVIAIVALGLMIDAHSRTPTDRPAENREPPTVFALGRVEGVTPEIELRPRQSGRVVEVAVCEGQVVEEGQVLLRLDDQHLRYEVALAAAQLELAQAKLQRLLNGVHPQQRSEAAALYRAKMAQLKRAELAWRRADELRREKAIPEKEADNRKTEFEAATAEFEAAKARLERLEAAARADEVRIENAQIQAAKARLELAKVQLEWTKLRAGCRGQVLKIDAQLGELAGPDSAEPAVVMADTSRFYIRAYIEEMDAPRVKIGMTAKIVADGLPDRQFTGRVIRLSPRMGRKKLWSDHPAERYDTKTREVWIELENEGALVLGLPVDVMIDPQSGSLTKGVRSGATKPGGRSQMELPPAAKAESRKQ